MKHASFRTLLVASALALTMASSPVLARRHGDQQAQEKKEALYPNATRKEPKLDLTSEREQKNLNEGLQAANEGDTEKAKQLLQPIIDNGSSSKYAQSLALQGMANLKYNGGDLKGAIADLSHSLEIGVLPNDTYFQLQYELAQFYLADEQYQKALDTLTSWREQGKKETADSYALEANADYRLQKYPEAIAAIQKAKSMTDQPKPSWDQILLAAYSESGQSDKAAQLAEQQAAANPNDATALNNAVATLMQAQQYPKAIALMEKARSNGALKDSKSYVNLAKLYLITGQQNSDPKPNADKAAAVLQEGLAKGIIDDTYENEKLLGDANYIGGNESKAIAAYKKAMPKATDGEAAIRAGQLLLSQNKFSQAREALRQGIDKGVQHKGTAYMLLAEAERGLKHKSAAVAAMREAAKDPQTAAKAKAWLKKAGSK